MEKMFLRDSKFMMKAHETKNVELHLKTKNSVAHINEEPDGRMDNRQEFIIVALTFAMDDFWN